MKTFQNNWENYLEIVEIPENMAVGVVSYALEAAKGDRGNKVFELSNHLGNVLATVSDKKLGRVLDSTSVVAAYYEGQVRSVQDYYAFGWTIPSRKFNTGSYRFGFNNQEKSEIAEGNTTALFWEYDSRAARRWNVDPKSNISVSPYTVFGDNPIVHSDIMGDTLRASSEGVIPTVNSEKTRGERLLDAIKGSFPGDKSKKLRDLFSLEKDGKTISSINEDDFAEAVAGLSKDEQALAFVYYGAINSQFIHIVDLLKNNEPVSSETKAQDNSNWPFRVRKYGGGYNYKVYKEYKDENGINRVRFLYTLSAVIIDRSSIIGRDFIDPSTGKLEPYSEPYGAVLAHELGHGIGYVTLSKMHSNLDALRMTNLYLRVHDIDYYRNGTSHGSNIEFTKDQANRLPNFAKIPKNLQAKIDNYEK